MNWTIFWHIVYELYYALSWIGLGYVMAVLKAEILPENSKDWLSIFTMGALAFSGLGVINGFIRWLFHINGIQL